MAMPPYPIMKACFKPLGSSFCLLVMAAAWMWAEEPPRAATPWGLPADPAASLVATTCGSCHSPYLITHHHRDRSGWEKTLVKMQANGMTPLPESFQEQVLDYLVRHQGPLERQHPVDSPWAQPAFHANPLWP